MAKISKAIICENCDSEFKLIYSKELVSTPVPGYCPFCSESLTHEEDEEHEDDDIGHHDYDESDDNY